MKKRTKKLTALLLAMVLVCSSAMMGYAQTEDDPTSSGESSPQQAEASPETPEANFEPPMEEPPQPPMDDTGVPADFDNSGDFAAPDGSGTPADFDNTKDSGVPDDSGTLGNPDNPEDSGSPGNPDSPDDPASPDASASDDDAPQAPGTASVSGQVWLDVDQNGRLDEGESGLEGYIVLLEHEQVDTVQTVLEIHTGPGGHYLFENLEPGSYRARVVFNEEQCAAMALTTYQACEDPSRGSDFHPMDDTVPEDERGCTDWLEAAAQSAHTANCGLIELHAPGAIEGLAWVDANGNGQRDEGEPGLQSVAFLQQKTDETSWTQVANQVAGEGSFTFNGLADGEYRLSLLLPDTRYSFHRENQQPSLLTESIIIEGGDIAQLSWPVYDLENPPGDIVAYGTGIPTGLKVELADGATPTLNCEYVPVDGGADPWAGGTINVRWNCNLRLTNSLLDLLNLSIYQYGFTFVALIDVPVLAKDWLSGIAGASGGYLSINEQSRPLSANNFMVYGDEATSQTLMLTMRGNNTDSGFFVWVVGILGGLPNLNNLRVEVFVPVDVAAATANGSPNDPSPNRVLTSGKVPPAPDKQTELAVHLYTSTQTWNDASGLFGIHNGNSNEIHIIDGITPAASVSAAFPSWNSYISPWDNQEVYNVPLSSSDGYQEVQDVYYTLPGRLGSRILEMDAYSDLFADAGTRFDRVVNLFTGENVTAGASLTHSPQALSVNTPTPVTYTGTDSEGTPLSPVALTVTDKAVNPQIEYVDTAPGPFRSDEAVALDFQWRGTTSRNGYFEYLIVTDGVYGSWQEMDVFTNDAPGAYHQDTLSLPAFGEPGRYAVWVRIVDNFDLYGVAIVEFDVTPMPVLEVTKTLTNLDTGETGLQISAAQNEVIESRTAFANTNSIELQNSRMQITLPAGTRYLPGHMSLLLKKNGLEVGAYTIDDSMMTDQLTIYLSEAYLSALDLHLVEDTQVELIYQYQVATYGTTITDDGAVLTGSWDNGGVEKSYTRTLETGIIVVAEEELSILSATSNISFGRQLVSPFEELYPMEGDFLLQIQDTLRNPDTTGWSVKATLTAPFQTITGVPLNCELIWRKDERDIVIDTEGDIVHINTALNHGLVEISFDKQADEGLFLRVFPQDVVSKIPYEVIINWSIVPAG